MPSKKFNLQTPGRTELNPGELAPAGSSDSEGGGRDAIKALAIDYYQALGGRRNIQTLDNCITRLRLCVEDPTKVDKAQLRQLGAGGVVKMGQYSLQVIVGSQAETLANAMKELSDAEANPSPLNSDGQTGTSIDIAAPIAGRVAVLSEVPDEVFAQKMIGDGLAIFPAEGSNQVCAPLAGTIASIFEAKHAFFIRTTTGQEILVHIGLDTVKLNGEGFTTLVAEGERVEVGEPVIAIDSSILRAKCPSLAIPVLCASMEDVKAIKFAKEAGSHVKMGTIIYSLELRLYKKNK